MTFLCTKDDIFVDFILPFYCLLSSGTSLTFDLFLKKANPGLFYRLFSVFSNKHHYNSFTTNICEKCPSGIPTHRNVSLLP